MQLIAQVLYNRYFHFVIFAAVILLLAMLGSIILTVGIGERSLSVENYTSMSRRNDARLNIDVLS